MSILRRSPDAPGLSRAVGHHHRFPAGREHVPRRLVSHKQNISNRQAKRKGRAVLRGLTPRGGQLTSPLFTGLPTSSPLDGSANGVNPLLGSRHVSEKGI